MADFILMEGDKALFDPTFGLAVVVVSPGTLTGSGPTTIRGKKLCVDGDEAQVEVKNCFYTAGAFAQPGTGTLKVKRLIDQQAKKTKSGDKLVLLRGTMFEASFNVDSPAKKPPPESAPDLTLSYSGTGRFTTENTLFQGT